MRRSALTPKETTDRTRYWWQATALGKARCTSQDLIITIGRFPILVKNPVSAENDPSLILSSRVIRRQVWVLLHTEIR